MRFVLEYKNGYIMSFIDDFNSTETMNCRSMDEAVYEMKELLKSKVRKSEDVIDSMKEMKELADDGRLAIDFFGIDLMNADEMRGELTKVFKSIAEEYLLTKCSR